MHVGIMFVSLIYGAHPCGGSRAITRSLPQHHTTPPWATPTPPVVKRPLMYHGHMIWRHLLNSHRLRQTAIPGDPRSQFERDFDRSVFSNPVKRLQDKAQVFPLDPHDAVRTRLTHSLEVSSVARGLAALTANWLRARGTITPDMERSIETIAATCGLIHDLGNPPFGHAGEHAIRAWFMNSPQVNTLNELRHDQLIQDFRNFEGNAQSLRLVAKLQILVDDSGLNLTFGTLSALMKYVATSAQADSKSSNHGLRKPGYFASETEIVERIQYETKTERMRNPISLLVEAADDISYLTTDVEDAVKKRELSWKQIKDLLKRSQAHSVQKALKNQKKILGANAGYVPGHIEDELMASTFRTAAIRLMTDSAFRTFKQRYEDIIDGQYPGSLVEDSDAADLAKWLRKIARDHVYPTRSTLELELMGRHVIGDLMDVFWEGARAMPRTGDPDASTFAGKAARLISSNYRKIFQNALSKMPHLPDDYHRFQLVTDYVCGMTDSFAKGMHAGLFNGR